MTTDGRPGTEETQLFALFSVWGVVKEKTWRNLLTPPSKTCSYPTPNDLQSGCRYQVLRCHMSGRVMRPPQEPSVSVPIRESVMESVEKSPLRKAKPGGVAGTTAGQY